MSRPRRDDYWYDAPTIIGIGSTHSLSGPDDEPVEPIGRILVPDPEQRKGWREHYVKPAPKPGSKPRSIGFGRP